MMKNKFILRVLAVAMALSTCLMLAGCGDNSNNGGNQGVEIGGSESSGSGNQNNTEGTFYFVHNNVKITPNDLVDPLITALGSDYSYYESPSCAYIGMDKCYVYSGFSIYTYPDTDAVDHVLQVVLTDDSLSTPEGLILGDTKDKVIELYGNDYKESDGSYSYTRGKTSLVIITKNDRVVSIQYNYTDSL